MKRSFDNIARVYARLESLTFGDLIERARDHALSAIDPAKPQTALLLGDGDGRFACRALRSNPLLHIDSIDNSPSMLRLAQSRIETVDSRLLERYSPIESNALNHTFETAKYDIVVTQFFLDCFQSEQANRLIDRLHASIKPKGRFAYADFSIPEKQPWNFLGRFLLKTLYHCFRSTTDIRATRLPSLQWPASLVPESRNEQLKGLLLSEIRSKR